MKPSAIEQKLKNGRKNPKEKTKSILTHHETSTSYTRKKIHKRGLNQGQMPPTKATKYIDRTYQKRPC